MKKVLIFGTGSLAKTLFEYLRIDNQSEVTAFCVSSEQKTVDTFCDLPVLDFETIQEDYPADAFDIILAIGYKKMRARAFIFNAIKLKGYSLKNYIHPSVIFHNNSIGEGNIILPGCVLEPGAKIGNNNVIWSMTLLGHDCLIGNHNYISAKCLISGDSKIGDMCFVGNGATMINGLIIEDETCVAAATYLRKGTQRQGLYSGNPAKLIKFNHNGIEIR